MFSLFSALCSSRLSDVISAHLCPVPAQMAVVLYHIPFSQPSNACRLFIFANGLEDRIEMKIADLSSPDYVKINPMKQVPALVDGDDVILESAAIMEYIAAKFEVPAHWVGTDYKHRARISSYLHWHHTHLRKGNAFFKTYFKHDDEDKSVDKELQIIEDSLKIIETHFLGSHPFIGGEAISIADLQVVSELQQASFGRLLHDLFDFPKVATLMQAVRSTPGWDTVFHELKEFNESLPPVKSQQVTIRGNREVLKNLRKARPKRQVKNKN